MKEFCPVCGVKLHIVNGNYSSCPNYLKNELSHFSEDNYVIYISVGNYQIEFNKSVNKTYIGFGRWGQDLILSGEIINLEEIKKYLTFL